MAAPNNKAATVEDENSIAGKAIFMPLCQVYIDICSYTYL